MELQLQSVGGAGLSHEPQRSEAGFLVYLLYLYHSLFQLKVYLRVKIWVKVEKSLLYCIIVIFIIPENMDITSTHGHTYILYFGRVNLILQ